MALEQPTCGEPNEARKQCWGCDVWTPYNVGFCGPCWELLSEAEKEVFGLSFSTSTTVGGSIRSALAQRVKDLRRPKAIYTPRAKTEKVKRALPDINLSLEDLEL